MSQGGAKGLHAHAVLLTAENHGPFYSHPGSEKVSGLPRAAQREGRVGVSTWEGTSTSVRLWLIYRLLWFICWCQRGWEGRGGDTPG